MAKRWTLDRVMRFILIGIGITLSILMLNYLSDALVPFGAALLIAYIIDPIVTWVQKKVKYRIVAVLIVLLSIAGLLTISGFIFIPQIIKEIHLLGQLLSHLFNDSTWTTRINQYIPSNIWTQIQGMVSSEQLISAMQTLDFWKGVHAVLSKILPGAVGVLSTTANVFIWISGTVMILMYLIFIMMDMPKFRIWGRNLIPVRYQKNASEFLDEMDYFMGNYFRSQTLVALSVGILFATAFTIIGFPMGFLFGLFVGALNMIPYLQLMSIPLALLLGVIYALDLGIPFWEVTLIIAGIYIAIQTLQDMILVPNIVGKSMNLPPAGILLSLSIWSKLLGFLGLIVAIPFTCLCLIYVKKIQRNYKTKQLSQKPVGKKTEKTGEKP